VRPKRVCGLPATDELVDFGVGLVNLGVGSLIEVSTFGGTGGASTGLMLGGSPSGRFFFSHHIAESLGQFEVEAVLRRPMAR